MEKEKKIISCETCNHRNVCYDLLTNTDYEFKGFGCLRYCRDITKDTVIISKEEYEKLISREKAQTIECKTIFNLRKQAKKELKAFAKEIKMAFYYEFDELIPSIMADKIDKIAEKYGVEIKE